MSQLITSEAMAALRHFSYGMDNFILNYAFENWKSEDITAEHIALSKDAFKQVFSRIINDPKATHSSKEIAEFLLGKLNFDRKKGV